MNCASTTRIYSPLFQRREQRDCAEKYLQGLLLELPRKSIEPMVLALEGADQNAVRAMQQFLSAGAWDDDRLLRRHWQEVDAGAGRRPTACCSWMGVIFPNKAPSRWA